MYGNMLSTTVIVKGLSSLQGSAEYAHAANHALKLYSVHMYNNSIKLPFWKKSILNIRPTLVTGKCDNEVGFTKAAHNAHYILIYRLHVSRVAVRMTNAKLPSFQHYSCRCHRDV